jgi:hypothetical protein
MFHSSIKVVGRLRSLAAGNPTNAEAAAIVGALDNDQHSAVLGQIDGLISNGEGVSRGVGDVHPV